MDNWTEMFLVFTHAVVDLIDSHGLRTLRNLQPINKTVNTSAKATI